MQLFKPNDKKFLEEKNHYMPTHPNSKQLKKDDMFGNDSRIVDKSYLQKIFVHQENVLQAQVDETVHKFKLNSEQE